MSKVVGSQPKMKVTKTNKRGRGQESEENLPYPSFPPIFFFFTFMPWARNNCYTCHAKVWVLENFKVLKFAVICFIDQCAFTVVQGLPLPAHHSSMVVLILHTKENLQHLLLTMNIKRMLNF